MIGADIILPAIAEIMLLVEITILLEIILQADIMLQKLNISLCKASHPSICGISI